MIDGPIIVTTGGRGFMSSADSADSTSLTFSTIPAICSGTYLVVSMLNSVAISDAVS